MDGRSSISPRRVGLKVTVRFFAVYRDRVGRPQFQLDLPLGATVGEVAKEIIRLFPHMAPNASNLVVAVNQEYADHSFTLHEGDEVAFIPPVSGGGYD